MRLTDPKIIEALEKGKHIVRVSVQQRKACDRSALSAGNVNSNFIKDSALVSIPPNVILFEPMYIRARLGPKKK